MYMMPDMIELGFPGESKWPSENHKHFACLVCLCNPNITNRDSLINAVSCVCKIPEAELETVTFDELVNIYGFAYL